MGGYTRASSSASLSRSAWAFSYATQRRALSFASANSFNRCRSGKEGELIASIPDALSHSAEGPDVAFR
jgi:hypothetical protein